MARISKVLKEELEEGRKALAFQSLFVPVEQAVALYELGFQEETITCYYAESLALETETEWLNYHTLDDCIPAPLWQQAFDWFDKKHKLEFYIRKEYAKLYGFKLWNGICYTASIEGELPDVRVKALDLLIETVKDGRRSKSINPL